MSDAEIAASLDPAAARRVRAVLIDCDGVLTDGRMIYVDRPTVNEPSGPDAGTHYEAKAFHVRDGMASVLLRMAGIRIALVTGEPSAVARRRAEKLRYEGVLLGVDDKVAEAGAWLASQGLDYADAAHVGDEVNDLGLMRRVGLSFAPADASPLVRREASYVSPVAGGQGVIRDVAYALLDARGELDDVLERYVAGERPASGTGT